MAWTIDFSDDAKKEFAKLDKPVQNRINKYLTERIEGCKNPRHFGEGLTANLAGLWRYRVGDYRIICQIEDTIVTVLVLSIGHRSIAYNT